MPDVFVSYNRQDRETAQLVAEGLKQDGFDVWWDAALRAGETYDEVTEKNLREAGAVVVLWSKRSATSKWVRAEATVGERSSTLVPALIEDCDRPVRFELVQTADLRHWRGDRGDPAWRLFVLDIKDAVAKRKSGAGRSNAAKSTDHDASIETTFWTSIKDSTDISDFEAYLARYPSGHFSELARNRLKAQAKPVAAPSQDSRRAEPAPVAKTVTPPREVRPEPRSMPKPLSAPRGEGPNFLMLGGIAAAVLAAVAAGVFLLRQVQAPQSRTDASIATEEAALVATPTPVAEAPAPSSAPAEAAQNDPAEPLPPAAAEQAPASPQPVVDASFQDCDLCPKMMRLAGGAFTMGSPESEYGRNAYEGPQREVSIKPFAIGAYEVTQEEWGACVADRLCAAKRADGALRSPTLGVSWREAQAYVKWLSVKTGKAYRLPTEAEWEFAARGGAATAYSWGEKFDRTLAARNGPMPVGSFAPNAFGLYDMHGNAREWVEDCYVNTYVGAPTDGSAVVSGDCSMRSIRGGAWSSSAADMRSANRSRINASTTAHYMGFRVAAPLQ